MIKLSTIQDNIAEELRALNNIMLDALSSNSDLLKSVVADYLASKGKQIRPILVILSAKVFGEVTDRVLHGAAAVELLHNASLIHDDVVDESKRRRGLPTINSTWDNHIAVLVGDFFVSRSLMLAVKTGDIRIISSMSTLGSELSRGEIDQIDNARNHLINEANYFDIIKHKTASLFRSCVEVGGFCVDAKGENFEKLREYAELLGLCFQIRDDIFDYFKDDTIGKPTGNDLREGKITLPLLHALSKTDAPNHAEMEKLAKQENLNAEEIDKLIEFAVTEGGIEYSYDVMADLKKRANELLADMPSTDALESFKSIFNYIIERKL